MNPNLKELIEAKKQEALRRLAKTKEQERLKQQNQQNNNLPGKQQTKVVQNQRFFPYTPFKPSTATSSSSSAHQQKQPVLQNLNNKSLNNSPAFKNNVSSSSGFKAQQPSRSKVVSSPINSRKVKCTFTLISESRFHVLTNAYDEQLINEFKKVPSKSYNGTTKVWSFLLKDYSLLIKGIKALKTEHTLEQIPDFVLKRMLAKSPSVEEAWLEQLEPSLLNCLLPFQRAGVLFGISRNGRVLIGDDPGLGKTRQALGIANYFKNYPMLIVTNASTREFWRNEIHKVLNVPDDAVEILSNKSYLDRADYVICSYSSLDTNSDVLLMKKFDTIILDESHAIKNPKAKQTMTSQKLSKAAKRIIMLTGTPALSRPLELFQQLTILDEHFATFHQFTMRYCNGHYNTFGYNANGSSNLEELKLLLTKTLLLRRIKTDVFSELDSKKRECVIVQDFFISKEVKDDFEEFSSQCRNNDENNKREKILLQWYNYTAEVKVKAACCYLEKLLASNNEKILAFAHHSIMMNALSEHLEKLGVGHVRIDGSVSGNLRSERVDIFQNNPNIRVAVLSTLATSAGITLTAASTVCFFELEFNPSTIIQAEARAHRIGQKERVKIFFLLAPGTADDVIWKMIVKKQSDLGKAGLVDAVEYLSENMETSKFYMNKQEQEKLDSLVETSNDSTDTFYTAASTNTNTSGNENYYNNEVQNKSNKSSNDELDALKKIEKELKGFSDDDSNEEEENNKTDEISAEELEEIRLMEEAFNDGNFDF